MKITGIVGMFVLLVGGAGVAGVGAQEAAKPDVSITLTETLNRIAPGPSTKDDLREVPPPPKNDRLRDSVRVTVIVDDGQCLPGEDGWMAQRPIRRARPR